MLALTKFVEQYISSCFFNECCIQEVQSKDKLIESYVRISEAKTYFDFATLVCKETRELFHSNNSKFLFVYNPISGLRSVDEEDVKSAEKFIEFEGGLMVYTSDSSGYEFCMRTNI